MCFGQSEPNKKFLEVTQQNKYVADAVVEKTSKNVIWRSARPQKIVLFVRIGILDKIRTWNIFLIQISFLTLVCEKTDPFDPKN